MADGGKTDRPTRNLRALVADDNAVNRMIAVGMLNRLGYDCDVAENGTEALEAASRTEYDIILMDVHMPEMDGYEATARIRENSCVPIVSITASALDEDRPKALAAGMNDYLSKPMKAKDLEVVLSRWVGSRTPPEGEILNRGILNRLREIGADREMTEAFLEETATLIVELRDAVSRDDPQAIRRAAHKLRGGAATMGATRVSRLSEKIETNAEDMSSVRSMLDELEVEFSATRDALVSDSS